jgi:aminopeptidase-like protein
MKRVITPMTDAPTFQPTPGLAMHRLMTDLYPICRSITGDGVRETLRILQQHIPLTMHEVPSGTQVFDWTVPDEWNIRDAYVMDSDGKRVIDFQQHNLHILNYSIPFRGKMTLDELMPHLHTAPNKPDAIPYRTSYYAPNWGFCLSHYQLLQMGAGEYEVVVDSTLEPGSLTYGEYVIPGETDAEVLITTHVCHPSMCNDNLSGIVTSVWLAKTLAQTMPRYTYRFLYIPATIGSITWLALNRDHVPRIAHGLTVTNMGDNGAFTYKKTWQGDHEIDRISVQVLRDSGMAHNVVDFTPYGYDERQFNSPAFRLPVGGLSRSPYDQYPEYHTSADNLGFVRPQNLEASYDTLRQIIEAVESNRRYYSLSPYGEPQLGKRGLYHAIAGDGNRARAQLALLWVLNLSDGNHDLLAMTHRSGLPYSAISNAAKVLAEHELLQVAKPAAASNGSGSPDLMDETQLYAVGFRDDETIASRN